MATSRTRGSVSFAEAVEAVSPLGDAIDGSERPRARRGRKPGRQFDTDNRRTFFCSNPQCDHDTWSPVEQARHMAREFWDVAQAIVRLAPESPEALRLTGGVILRELTDDECRDWNNRWKDGDRSVLAALGASEYSSRQYRGVLEPPSGYRRARRFGDREYRESLMPNPVQLRELRSAHGYSMWDLADMIGVDSSSILNWEQGCMPSMEPLRKLLAALGLDADRMRSADRDDYIARRCAEARAARKRMLPPPEKRKELRERLTPTPYGSKVKLARMLGVSTVAIWAWEHGRDPDTHAMRLRYAEALGWKP